jgi:hypothetical protein
MTDSTLAVRPCTVCATPIVGRANKVYCSQVCKDKDRPQRNRSGRVFWSTCETCGSDMPGRGKFCSALCRPIVERSPRTVLVPSIVACRCCGAAFVASRRRLYCSSSCSGLAGFRKMQTDIAYGDCRQCGVLFVRRAGQVGSFCSGKCSRKAGRRTRKRRLRHAASDGHTLRDVAVRDGWRCHLCGRKVPDRPYTGHGLDATEDHLIPVSAGGNNLLSNVKLAHRDCNIKRSTGGEVQLLLVG